MKYEVRKNEQYNSNEVYFEGKPSVEVRDGLKALRMRWNRVKCCWYGFATEEEIANAVDGKKVEQKKVVNKPVEKKNEHGVKVGDLFYASWGYDQTNINIFQVVELVGKQSVRVKEVCPKVEKQEFGFMCRDVSFTVTNKPLPATDYSVFIKNQKDGDLKRIQKSGLDGSVYFKLDTFANAYPYHGGTLYNSWYA